GNLTAASALTRVPSASARVMLSDPDKRFDRTVPVHLRPGRIHMVGSAREAAEKLLFEWPGDREAAKHRAARRACLRALEGLADARKARLAFEAAAKDAGILVDGVRR